MDIPALSANATNGTVVGSRETHTRDKAREARLTTQKPSRVLQEDSNSTNLTAALMDIPALSANATNGTVVGSRERERARDKHTHSKLARLQRTTTKAPPSRLLQEDSNSTNLTAAIMDIPALSANATNGTVVGSRETHTRDMARQARLTTQKPSRVLQEDSNSTNLTAAIIDIPEMGGNATNGIIYGSTERRNDT